MKGRKGKERVNRETKRKGKGREIEGEKGKWEG